MSVTEPSLAPAPVRDPVTNRRLDHRLTYALLGLGVLVVLVVYVVWRTYPNYDTYYTLVWGRELANGRLPEYDVFRTPTPHPLATLVGWVMAPFGTASDRILVLLSLFGLLGFYVVAFIFTERLLGRVIALLAVAVMVTRTDMQLLALRAMFDLPFYLMVFGAALLELRRPRCGLPVLVLLALAGLLRPEAWLLAGVYWLYLARASPRPQLARLALLVVAAPLLWMAADLVVTGEPLYSFTSTREVSGEFGRNRGLADAIRSIPTFLLIAAAGLSVIPRYLTIPSLLLSLCVAIALGGWRLVVEPTARKVAIGVAVVSVLVLAWRAPFYVRDVQKLGDQATFIEHQHRGLKGILDAPAAVEAIQRCHPITVPTHSAIPVIRFETGLPKDALEASIGQRRRPRGGTLLIGDTFNFEPSAARATNSNPSTSSRRRWSNKPLPGFERLARRAPWM